VNDEPTYFRTGLRRPSRKSDGVSNVDHIATVDHSYGPYGNRAHMTRPLCGTDGGQAVSSNTDEVCGRCRVIAESRGLDPRDAADLDGETIAGLQ